MSLDLIGPENSQKKFNLTEIAISFMMSCITFDSLPDDVRYVVIILNILDLKLSFNVKQNSNESV